MRRSPLLLLCLLLATIRAPAQESLSGDWQGMLVVNMFIRLPITLHLTSGVSPAYTAKFDSPSQDVNNIAVDRVSFAGNQLVLDVASLHGSYAGTLDSSQTKIEGFWTQKGKSLPLNFTRVPAAVAQPVFTQQDVSYANPATLGLMLAATFTKPKTGSRFPTILLVPTTSASDRDEATPDRNTSMVLAVELSKSGIASLRTDARGVSKSGGTAPASTPLDVVSDTMAAIQYLENRPDVDGQRIGVFARGASAAIVPQLARSKPGLAFAVLIAPEDPPADESIAGQTDTPPLYAEITIPVLTLFPTKPKDIQVPPDRSPMCGTCTVGEYEKAGDGLAPATLATIVDWIKRQTTSTATRP